MAGATWIGPRLVASRLIEALKRIDLSGLVPGEAFTEAALDVVLYRLGDSGTFHRLASSGKSSSESRYSSSSSLAVFRLGCHEPLRLEDLLTESEVLGRKPGVGIVVDLGEIGIAWRFLGDGERDWLPLRNAVLAKEEDDGLFAPPLVPWLFGRFRERAEP